MPQPPRNDSKIVAIVVVVVVLVVIVPIVVSVVLYTMVSGLLDGSGPPTSRPIVTFAQLTKGGTPPDNHTASWTVAGASEPISFFSSFKVQITRDGSPIVSVAQTLRSNQLMTFGASTVRLILRDLAGEGKLTGGDSFLVYGMSQTHNWKFSLIWAADGSEINSSSWSTP